MLHHILLNHSASAKSSVRLAFETWKQEAKRRAAARARIGWGLKQAHKQQTAAAMLRWKTFAARQAKQESDKHSKKFLTDAAQLLDDQVNRNHESLEQVRQLYEQRSRKLAKAQHSAAADALRKTNERRLKGRALAAWARAAATRRARLFAVVNGQC